MLDLKCIIAVVERGSADKVVDAAKEVGASGATVFYARGTGTTEAQKFFNISVEQQKEIIMILSHLDEVDEIINAMAYAAEIKKPGTGVIFTLDVESLMGLKHRVADES